MRVRVFCSDDLDRMAFESFFAISFHELNLELEFLKPPQDPCAGRDAAEMLSRLLRMAGAHPTIWVVDVDLFLRDVGTVFGCSAGRCAIATISGLSRRGGMNVVMHEIGHILGLDHCSERCLMCLARDSNGVENRPFALCDKCYQIAKRISGSQALRG